MKKFLFLGNSHIGAFRKADKLYALSSRFSCSSNFIGIPGRGGFYRLSLDGAILLTLASYKRFMEVDAQAYSNNSSNRIDLKYFDCIVFVAGLSRLDSRLYYQPSSSYVPLLSKSVIKSVVMQDSAEDRRIQQELPPLFWRLMSLGKPEVAFLGAPLVSVDAAPIRKEVRSGCCAQHLMNPTPSCRSWTTGTGNGSPRVHHLMQKIERPAPGRGRGRPASWGRTNLIPWGLGFDCQAATVCCGRG